MVTTKLGGLAFTFRLKVHIYECPWTSLFWVYRKGRRNILLSLTCFIMARFPILHPYIYFILPTHFLKLHIRHPGRVLCVKNVVHNGVMELQVRCCRHYHYHHHHHLHQDPQVNSLWNRSWALQPRFAPWFAMEFTSSLYKDVPDAT